MTSTTTITITQISQVGMATSLFRTLHAGCPAPTRR
jgi:hypothetical protein